MLSERGRQIENRRKELKRVQKLNGAILDKIHQERSDLDQHRSKVADEERALASKRRDVEKLRTQLKQRETKLSAVNKKLDRREKSLAKKETNLKAREKKTASIPKSRKEFAARVKKFEQQLLRLRNKVARQEGEIDFLRGYSEVADWAGTGLGSGSLWPNVEHAVIVGEGPYDNTELTIYLEGQEFLPVPPGSADASIMIVGRDDWSEEELELQIEAREGLELRVYSQEMLLLAIALGRDPLEECDFDQLVSLFASDHSALQYLIESGFEWPNVGTGDLEDTPSREGWGVKESPLHLMGYHVGRSSDLTTRERHRILKSAYEGPLISIPIRSYMREWGRPKTARRLWRMAHHVAHLANSQGRGKKIAGTHWAQDLRWMKKELFRPWMKFKWPSTRVPRK
jgi:hypothetical protein